MIEIKPDMRVDLFCPTCKRTTPQAMLEGLLFHCTICCENHTLEENTQQTNIALRELMRASQQASGKISR